jgi:hypothetical protein
VLRPVLKTNVSIKTIVYSTQALVNAPHETRDTDEFERLAKKFCSEHAGKVGNAWLVLYYVGRYVGWSVGSTAKLTPLDPTLLTGCCGEDRDG